eukprot:7382952-Prymnesium_polylepis.1
MEASADYLLSTKPNTKQDLMIIAAAAMQHGILGHVAEGCKQMFFPDGNLAPEDRICVSICDELLAQGYTFRNGYLETPKTHMRVSLPRLGKHYCYCVKLNTLKHMPGLSKEQHKDATTRDTFAVALNTLFGMNINTHFKPYNPSYDWQPHPLWAVATNNTKTAEKYTNKWVKYVDPRDAYFRAGMSQVFKESGYLFYNHGLKSSVATSVVILGTLQKAGMLDIAGPSEQALRA